MKKTKLSLPQNDFLTIDYQGISKQVNLQDEDYICLNDLLEFFPNKRMQDWKDNKNTKEFVKLVEKILNNANQRDLKKAIYAKRGKYGGGTFAHEFVALEFLTWLSPEFKLMVLVQWNRWRKEKYNPLIIKQFVVDYVREALHDLETRMREMMVNEYLQIEDFNQDIDRLNSFALHVNQQLLSLAAQQAKLKTQIETMEEEQRTEGKSWVYLLYNPKSEEYKIGYTSDLKTRQKNFQSTEPDIEIYLKIAVKTPRQALNLESFFHIEFDDKRTHGEWFRLDGNDLNKLKGFVGVLGK
ncbi:MAG: KilA-N domain-containing protein [Microscillaceae bacterium]|jgi:hypothetical protein|nr:KilA-N domain-containing protein [Microscillaceae bacterium]